MVNVLQLRATLRDLYDVDEPAELINGIIVRDMTGERPSEVAANIYLSLRAHAKSIRRGKAHPDGVGYTVPLMPSGRESD